MTVFKSQRTIPILLAVAGAMVLVLSVSGRPRIRTQDLARDLVQADELYRRGQFDEAARLYDQVAGKSPDSYGAALGLGRIFVLRNALSEAEAWLKKALALKPEEKEPRALMGEVLYRRNDYVRAAPFFEAVNQTAKAEILRTFQDKIPFAIETGPDISSLAFIRTDPLPSIKVTVNGQEGTFLIDTGGWELYVMPAFAEKCGLKPMAQKQTGTYARKDSRAWAAAGRSPSIPSRSS